LPDTLAAVADLLAGRAVTRQLEKRYLHKQGHVIWAQLTLALLRDADGRPQYLIAQMQDITERKQAEADRASALAALRESEQRFRSLIENAVDPISILDAEGVIHYASPAHLRVLGHAPEELLGTNAFALLHPEDVPAVTEIFRQLLAEPGALRSAEFRYRHKNGSWRTLAAVGSNLLHDPAVAGIVINSHDVTEQHLLEAQLRQAQKLEAVGQLAGGIAHDFNNILTAIASNVELALTALPVDHPVQGDLHEIKRATTRAAAFTRQLLAFSRKQVLQPRPVSLNEVVSGTERLLRRTLTENIALTTALDPTVGLVRADPGQLEQVVMNLAVNARDAMPNGGVLSIRTSNVDVTPGAVDERGPLPAGAYVCLEVRDSGTGMDAQTQLHIFEPFFTTKEPGRGTGLGLATVYGIVKQSGGHIRVESAPNRGSVFSIYLPRVAEQPAAASEPAPLPVRGTGGERILLVEDEAAVRISVRRILERHGYQVWEAGNGTEALQRWDREHGAIDLVLSDVVMPGMGGRELIAALRARQPAVRVVLMSGYADAMGSLVTPEAEDVPFIEKPFQLDVLLARLREVLSGSGR
ncbi:MAG: PAS domain S-box protein, partial [Gemmatimonadaceae bacterium]|nr:PAS domain S-box protein [Gemmatimonadaceae bacterium]